MPFLLQVAVLQFRRGYVVEHGEAGGGREVVRREAGLGGIGVDDVHVRAGQPIGQRARQIRVDLDGGDLRRARSKQVGGEPRAWADLEDVVAQVRGREDPRQEVRLEHLGPLGAREEREMGLVHGGRSTRCGGRARAWCGRPCVRGRRPPRWRRSPSPRRARAASPTGRPARRRSPAGGRRASKPNGR